MAVIKPKQRQWLFNLARIVISAGLLVWIIRSAGLAHLVQAARAADWRLYGLAAVLALVGIVNRGMLWMALQHEVVARENFRRTR